MATISQLKLSAESKGFKFEIDYPQSIICSQKTYNELTFRFTTGKGVWYNFTTIGCDKLENEEVFDFERYSQNNGKSIKSFANKYIFLHVKYQVSKYVSL